MNDLGKKIATGIGVAAGLITIGGLLSQYLKGVKPAEARPAGIKVTLVSEPYPVEILVDGEPVKAPAELFLQEGWYTFQTSRIALDLLTEYAFYCWMIDDKIVSYDTEMKTYISKPVTIRAVYLLSESYPAVIPMLP